MKDKNQINNEEFLKDLSTFYQKQIDKDFLSKNILFLNVLSNLNDNFDPMGYCYLPPNTKIGQKITVPVSDNKEDREEIQNIIKKNRKTEPKKSNNELYMKTINFLKKKVFEFIKELNILEKNKQEYITELNNNDNENKQEYIDQIHLFQDQTKVIINKINLSLVALELNDCMIDLHDIAVKQNQSKADVEIEKETIEFIKNVEIQFSNNDLLNINNNYFKDDEIKKKIQQNNKINLNEYSTQILEAVEYSLNENLNNDLENSSEIRKLLKRLININDIQIENLSKPSNFIKEAINNTININNKEEKVKFIIETHNPEFFIAIDISQENQNIEDLYKENLKLVKFLSKEFSRDYEQYKNILFENCLIFKEGENQKKHGIAINMGEVYIEKTVNNIMNILASNLQIKNFNLTEIHDDEFIKKSLKFNSEKSIYEELDFKNENKIEINPKRNNDLTIPEANYLALLNKNSKPIEPDQRKQIELFD